MTGYLQGQTTFLTLEQRLEALRSSDQTVGGVNPSVIPPTSGQGQGLPNIGTAQSRAATSIPQLLTTVSNEPTVSTIGAPTNVEVDRAVNLGTGGVAILQASTFEVRYRDSSNVPRTFNFSLLPAMETNLRSSHMGASVPEVKPGILMRTSMNYKRFSIPGSSPVFQSLGIEQSILQIVGLFVGTEGDGVRSPDPALYGRFQDTLKLTSANQHAERFDREIVKAGREVTMFINSQGSDARDTLTLTYKCCIQNFRVFIVRFDRVYYAMDAVITEYPTTRLVAPTVQSSPDPTPSTTLRPTTPPQSRP